jgi:cob(I)alamin adenosyltransferase
MKKASQKQAPRKVTGLVVVLTGDGKGKTTSALGMAVRAAGHGMKVCIIHFMKGGLHAGEFDGIKLLGPNVEDHVMGKGFCGIPGDRSSPEEHRESAQAAVRFARERLATGAYDLMILDEVNIALKLNLVDLHQLLGLIDKKPARMHLVLTGRDAHPDIIARAHTVTEMREIKHAYQEKIEPQKGVDY